jgi:hypothetical protein
MELPVLVDDVEFVENPKVAADERPLVSPGLVWLQVAD